MHKSLVAQSRTIKTVSVASEDSIPRTIISSTAHPMSYSYPQPLMTGLRDFLACSTFMAKPSSRDVNLGLP